MFEQSTVFLLKGLGVKVELIRNNHRYVNPERIKIHIANHISPFDILLIQGYFKIPTITTSHTHLKKICPFIQQAIRNYGHCTMDYKDINSRISALRSINNKLMQRNNIFIFPNGSLYTTINERFSPSIEYLSDKHDAIVIPWIIKYNNNIIDISKINYKPIKLIINRLIASEVTLKCKEGDFFDPRDYEKRSQMTSSMRYYYSQK